MWPFTVCLSLSLAAVTATSSSISLPHSSTSHSTPLPTSVVTGYTTSFAQLPGFMYPIPSLNMPLVMTDTNKKGQRSLITINHAPQKSVHSTLLPRPVPCLCSLQLLTSPAGDTGVAKRRNDTPSEGSDDAKRPRVATATPPTQSTSSSPSPQPPLLRPTPQRSPVIKYNLLPYNIGENTIIVV